MTYRVDFAARTRWSSSENTPAYSSSQIAASSAYLASESSNRFVPPNLGVVAARTGTLDQVMVDFIVPSVQRYTNAKGRITKAYVNNQKTLVENSAPFYAKQCAYTTRTHSAYCLTKVSKDHGPTAHHIQIHQGIASPYHTIMVYRSLML
jgi:hypothetical protein